MRRRRFSRSRATGSKRQVSWLNGANSTSWTTRSTESTALEPQQTRAEFNGVFEMLGASDLDAYEGDITVMRVIGDFTWVVLGVELGTGEPDVDPVGMCCRAGIFAMRSGGEDTVTVPNPNDNEDTSTSWMWTSTSYTTQVGGTTVSPDQGWAHRVYSGWNTPQTQFDFNVKRKVEHGGTVMFCLQFHPMSDPWVSPHVVRYGLIMHSRILVAH